MTCHARVGVISDTHDLLRPEVVERLRGVDLVIHAGDVGSPMILDALASVAPVQAVRGNTDSRELGLPETRVVELTPSLLVYVIHDLGRLDLDPAAAGMCAVISGHSHRPQAERRGGVLYLNPGSAGPRRFSLPVSLALLRVTEGGVEGEIVVLDV